MKALKTLQLFIPAAFCALISMEPLWGRLKRRQPAYRVNSQAPLSSPKKVVIASTSASIAA
jgi:hypothetical protein